MDKRTRNHIIQLIATIEEGLSYIKTSQQKGMFNECLSATSSILESCRRNLSAERYNHCYAQKYDTLLELLCQGAKTEADSIFVDKVCDRCSKLLQSVSRELMHEREVKKEILFLPYKASMWDSMESIWLAANADKKYCDTYVMPIPYCDRKPDRTAGKWHCEASLFPDYVPVIDYRQYNFAERRPDVIYIHNPYDGSNYVTSVDSRYYSQELKKYTDMLVYVPYFILGDIWPEAQSRLACYKYMDKMIVPHERIQIQSRQRENHNAKYLHDYVPKRKLVPLGSPKADKVLFSEQNKKVYDDWQTLIAGRKVILYNISISGILEFGDKMLRKMQYVFSCFADRSDAILLWRPHPLLQATLRSMRPDLYEKYKHVEAEFVSKRIGILDTSPDIDRAVAMADAYLGESTSSIVHLFGLVGKPIFFTSEIMLWKNPFVDEVASIRFSHMEVQGQESWFIAEGYNALCKMDLASGKVVPVVKFENSSFMNNLYSRFLHIGNQILFSPGNAQTICLYNKQTQEIREIPFKNPRKYDNFGHIIKYKDDVFLLPWRYPAILRYHLQTGKCTYYAECLKELMSSSEQQSDELLGGFAVRDNKLLLPSVKTNKILEFDMETGNYCYYKVGEDGNGGYADIIENEDEYWLIPRKPSAIIKWNYITKKWRSYEAYPAGFHCNRDWFSGEPFMFSGVVKMNGGIWLFPCYANMILRIDLVTEKIERVNIELPYDVYQRKTNFYLQQPNFFGAFAGTDNSIVAMSAYDRSLVIVDTLTRTCRLQACRFTESEAKNLAVPLRQSFRELWNVPYATNESALWRNVSDFISYVVSGTHNKQKQQEAYKKIIKNIDGSCGEKVHQHIMGYGKL